MSSPLDRPHAPERHGRSGGRASPLDQAPLSNLLPSSHSAPSPAHGLFLKPELGLGTNPQTDKHVRSQTMVVAPKFYRLRSSVL